MNRFLAYLTAIVSAACSAPVAPALSEGARFQQNPDAADRGSWQPIDVAPRDGTIIETRNTYGVAPWYGLHRWVDGRWQDATRPNMSTGEGSYLRWRPYQGEVAAYVDPTGGLQAGAEYWRGAAASEAGLPLDAFEEQAEKNHKEQEQFGDGRDAPYWPKSKSNGDYTLHRGVWVDDLVPVPSNAVLDEVRKEHARRSQIP